MKSMYGSPASREILRRIDALTHDATKQWGKMSVSQMLAHCCIPIEISLGDKKGGTSIFGKLFGRIAKKQVLNDKPFKMGIPTDKSFIVNGTPHFDTEKQKLKSLVKRFSDTEPYILDGRKHPFFGRMNYLEWSNLTYKHLDHHLRQFNA